MGRKPRSRHFLCEKNVLYLKLTSNCLIMKLSLNSAFSWNHSFFISQVIGWQSYSTMSKLEFVSTAYLYQIFRLIGRNDRMVYFSLHKKGNVRFQRSIYFNLFTSQCISRYIETWWHKCKGFDNFICCALCHHFAYSTAHLYLSSLCCSVFQIN